ncbi:MAG TPA: TIGR00730 family Rossman fold protein [Chitinophagaceae bacterium]|nr:TIGR00730 family Rossman fold protein [Chitinophagaceae bacterium]
MQARRIAVFCGSKRGNNALYREHAQELGRLIAEHGITLVYGGGNVGLMGIIADSVITHNGKVTGIIPKMLLEWERQHQGITELIVADDMHLRKKNIYSLVDAAVILPGGFGTLDEFFEILTWNQLSIHDKQIFILNSGGFYDHLIAHIELMKKEGFLYEQTTKRLVILHQPEDLFSYLD